MFKKLKQTIAEATAEGAFATAATPSDITPKGSQTTGLYWIIAGISIVFLLYQLYMGLVRPLPPFIAGPIHLCLALIITILSKPLAAKTKMKWTWTIDLLMVACITFIGFYFITNLDRLTYRIMMVDKMLPVDLFCSLALLVIIMEMVRRTLGMNLFIFILLFIAYAFLGQYLTGPFRYSGMTWQQFAEMLTLSTDGIFGSPLSTSVNSLFYFLLFGAFFATCGGGEVLIDCGMKLSDKTAGGPAKAAVVSSGLMGMISGSAVANVTTTGVLTIPLMKRAGYTPEQAGAVESVASTGGQIMPPIMKGLSSPDRNGIGAQESFQVAVIHCIYNNLIEIRRLLQLPYNLFGRKMAQAFQGDIDHIGGFIMTVCLFLAPLSQMGAGIGEKRIPREFGTRNRYKTITVFHIMDIVHCDTAALAEKRNDNFPVNFLPG